MVLQPPSLGWAVGSRSVFNVSLSAVLRLVSPLSACLAATKKFGHERASEGHSRGAGLGAGPPVALPAAVKELKLRFEVVF